MIEVGKETFAAEVVGSELPVVVDFWGPQCGPCLALLPDVLALGEKYHDRVKMTKIEAPKNRRLCLELKVLALPTFLFYKGGQECGRLAGSGVSVQTIEESIQKMLG